MANLREIRNRIKSVKNTAQITKAMQLVAASKMKRAQDVALKGRPYSFQLARMLASVAEKATPFTHPFLEAREVKTRGILVITTDKGLCGALNSNLLRKVTEIGKSAKYVSIGRKGTQFLSRGGYDLVADFPVSDHAYFREVRPVLDIMLKMYKEGTIDTVEVLFPRFRNTLVQEPTLLPFLPLESLPKILESLVASGEMEAVKKDDREIIFEPSANEILTKMLEMYIRKQIYQTVLEAKASEHSARMVAMKTATDNAKELVQDLTLQYNKARQASITQEILELTAASQ